MSNSRIIQTIELLFFFLSHYQSRGPYSIQASDLDVFSCLFDGHFSIEIVPFTVSCCSFQGFFFGISPIFLRFSPFLLLLPVMFPLFFFQSLLPLYFSSNNFPPSFLRLPFLSSSSTFPHVIFSFEYSSIFLFNLQIHHKNLSGKKVIVPFVDSFH